VATIRDAVLFAGLLPALAGQALAPCAGCGRRATRADCQLIVDKSVELQMKEMSLGDPGEIAKREQQVRLALEGEIKSCEGRHVTDATLACVNAATTTRGLDACLR
jgi:hypothetical protein